jgi:hypothetical protein
MVPHGRLLAAAAGLMLASGTLVVGQAPATTPQASREAAWREDLDAFAREFAVRQRDFSKLYPRAIRRRARADTARPPRDLRCRCRPLAVRGGNLRCAGGGGPGRIRGIRSTEREKRVNRSYRPDGKPDFSGVYGLAEAGDEAGDRGGAAPAGPQLKPGAEKYRVQRGPQDTGRTSDCMPLPPPDAFGVPCEFQVIQNKDHLVIIHEYPGSCRIVPLDGEPHQVDPDPAWLDDSVGKWEGDTLVIDTIGCNEKTEIAGYRHSDALHTVERLRRVDGGFDYEITIEDPNVFVAPFTQTRSFRTTAAPLKRIMEFTCENNRDYRPLFGTPGAAPAK